MKAIYTAQGYQQSVRFRTGTEDLYFAEDGIRSLATPHLHTRPPVNWNHNVAHDIAQLARQGYTRLALVSYSHGQAAAQAAAREAAKHNLAVDLWLACDPVYRPTWLPRWNIMQPLAFRALLRKGKIQVPSNIAHVIYVRQTLNRPNGHDLIEAPNSLTIVEKPRILPYPHNLIDDCPEWHTLAMHHLRKWAAQQS
jgi:hypothetical protein